MIQWCSLSIKQWCEKHKIITAHKKIIYSKIFDLRSHGQSIRVKYTREHCRWWKNAKLLLYQLISLLCHCICFMLSTDAAEAEDERWRMWAVPISDCLIERKRQQLYERQGPHHSSQLCQENRFNLSALETLTLIVKKTDTSIQ